MTAKLDSPPDKTRDTLLAAGWILLALSLGMCIVGPRLNISDLPADLRRSMGDLNWMGLDWIMGGMIVGALALMCFLAQWVLRPRRIRGSAAPLRKKSKAS
ncbi:MAG: hypothetical protein WA738_14605 [Candidatus Angelobacter sp.]